MAMPKADFRRILSISVLVFLSFFHFANGEEPCETQEVKFRDVKLVYRNSEQFKKQIIELLKSHFDEVTKLRAVIDNPFNPLKGVSVKKLENNENEWEEFLKIEVCVNCCGSGVGWCHECGGTGRVYWNVFECSTCKGAGLGRCMGIHSTQTVKSFLGIQ